MKTDKMHRNVLAPNRTAVTQTVRKQGIAEGKTTLITHLPGGVLCSTK